MAKIADVIKYEGDNTTFIWKHPCEDFNSLTQLIVHESQEAIFFMNGEALDLFGPGRHTLETQNLPKLGKFLNRATGDETPFHCEVYFINKTEQMAIKWGTDSRVEYLEPQYGFPISIGASGEMSLRVADSRKLLLKLVGTERVLGRQQLCNFFRAFLMTCVKAYIAQTMRTSAISIFEIDEHLLAFSQALQTPLTADFAAYGVALERFFVTNIVKPDGERQYETFKSLHFRQYADIAEAKLRQQTEVIQAQTEAQKTVIASQAMATKRAQEGYTYQQERGFDVASQVAQNDTVAQFTNLGVGLGTMAGVGGMVGGMVGGAVNTAMQSVQEGPTPQTAPAAGAAVAPQAAPAQNRPQAARCPVCGEAVPQGAKFCPECGEKIVPPLPEGMVHCPGCDQVVPQGKFCPECGQRLLPQCPQCGADLAPGAKYCPECGEKLK